MRLPDAWTRRPERERRAIATAAAAVGAILFVTFAVLPLERLRARLEREVPELRASVGQLRKDAQEVQRLRALPAVSTGSAAPLAALASGTLAAPPGARLTLVDDRRLKLAAADMAFAALVDWLATAPGAQGLHVENARVEALAVPGRVRAEITLARS